MTSFVTFKPVTFVQSLLLASVVITPITAYSQQNPENLQQIVLKQNLEISRLNKQIQQIKEQNQNSIQALTLRLNNLDKNSDIDTKIVSRSNDPVLETIVNDIVNINNINTVLENIELNAEDKEQNTAKAASVNKTTDQEIHDSKKEETIPVTTKNSDIPKETIDSKTDVVVNGKETSIASKIESPIAKVTANVAPLVTASVIPYIEDQSTPESEKINVAPEVLFAQRFGTDFKPSTQLSESQLDDVVARQQAEVDAKEKAETIAVDKKEISVVASKIELPIVEVITNVTPLVTATETPYIDDKSTPESEKINVAPEILFAQTFSSDLKPSTKPSETYLKALQAFSADDIDTAISEFKRYIHYHSDHSLIAKAHYWLGMSYIKQEPANYAAARFEFMEVINRFEYHLNNDKKPKALYRLAQLSKINNYDTDVSKYVGILNQDYPNSPELQLAKKLLD